MRVPFAIGCMAAVLAWAPLPSQEDCCMASLNVGFSTQVLRGAPPFEGIEGLGPECDGARAVVDHVISAGPQRVYLNVVSNFPLESDGGVQGWSLIVALTGGGDFVSVTTAGTAADLRENGGFWSGGFNKTEVLVPFRAGWRRRQYRESS